MESRSCPASEGGQGRAQRVHLDPLRPQRGT